MGSTTPPNGARPKAYAFLEIPSDLSQRRNLLASRTCPHTRLGATRIPGLIDLTFSAVFKISVSQVSFDLTLLTRRLHSRFVQTLAGCKFVNFAFWTGWIFWL